MSLKPGATDLSRASDSDLIIAVRRRLADEPGASSVVKDIADDLGVTPRRLDRAFRNNLGVSLAAYARRERLRVAQRLLLQTSRPIQNIADELGFSCSANFATVFRDVVGVSPSEYRRDPAAHRDLTTSDVKWGQGPV